MEEGTVVGLSKKGYGLVDQVEVAHTIPGDQIEYILTRKKRLPKKGRLERLIVASNDRVEPKCAHAGVCGGCAFQVMDYPAQLKHKQKIVENAFGKKASPIVPSPSIWGYRNKMEFSFSINRAGTHYLGLMIAQAEPYVFNLSECHLVSSWFAKVVGSVRSWWEKSGILAYIPPKNEGSLRYLTLREGVQTGEKMAILNVSGNPDYALSKEQLNGFVEAVKEGAGEEISIFLRIHQAKKGKPTQFYEMHLGGNSTISEVLHLEEGSLQFEISPISFFQPNTLAAQKLYQMALEHIDPSDLVYDLYAGTGTLSIAAALKAKEVIAIELSPEAVLDGEKNAEENGVKNLQFYQGDVGKVLEEKNLPSPDVVILDPPRAGLDDRAMKQVIELLPKKIIYISCNPLTQATNAEEFIQTGYQIQSIQPLDQFPHTNHVENIVIFDRSS